MKIEKSKRSGSGTEDIYKSHLWYFNLLTFLIQHETPTDSIDNKGSPTSPLESEDAEVALVTVNNEVR